MITAEFFVQSDGLIRGFHVRGHSGYADEGQDIVCAAVSSCVIMVMNTIGEVMKIGNKASTSNGDAFLKISKKNAGECQNLLQGLKLHLNELQKQYSEFITIKFTEV